MAFAHSENSRGFKHDLATHLQQVAELASKFAEKFGAGDLGRWVGLWHDLGKFHPDFQAYLSDAAAHHGPDHKGAGAVQASKLCDALAFLVAGHHGGLLSRADLKNWLREKTNEGGREPRRVHEEHGPEFGVHLQDAAPLSAIAGS